MGATKTVPSQFIQGLCRSRVEWGNERAILRSKLVEGLKDATEPLPVGRIFFPVDRDQAIAFWLESKFRKNDRFFFGKLFIKNEGIEHHVAHLENTLCYPLFPEILYCCVGGAKEER